MIPIVHDQEINVTAPEVCSATTCIHNWMRELLVKYLY